MDAKGFITMEEYIRETEKIKKQALESELNEIKDGEVLLLSSHYISEITSLIYGDSIEIFKKPKDLFDYISSDGEIMEIDVLDFDGRSVWFKVIKYITYNGEYRASVRFDIDAYCNILAVQFYVPSIDKRGHRTYKYDKRNEFLMFPQNISYPFEIGDIISVNPAPYSEPFEIVYCGMATGSKKSRTFNCVYHSEFSGALSASMIGAHFTDRLLEFPNAPINMLKYVEYSNDELLERFSIKLKEQPEFWQECVDRYEKEPYKSLEYLL